MSRGSSVGGSSPYSNGKPFTIDAFKFDPRTVETLNTALVGAGSVQAGIDLPATFSNAFIDGAQKLMM